MTYTVDYDRLVSKLNAKQQKLFEESDGEATEELLQNADKFWELAYNRTAELAEANGIQFPAYDDVAASEFLFSVYDDGESWPDDDELLDELNDWF